MGSNQLRRPRPERPNAVPAGFCVPPPHPSLSKYLRSGYWEFRGEQSRTSVCPGGSSSSAEEGG